MIDLLKAIKIVRDFLVPPYCFHCREYIYNKCSRASDYYICSACALLIRPIISKRLELGTEYILPVHAVSAYEEPLKSLVLAKAWSDYTASKQLAHIMWDYSMIQSIPFDYIVSVPSHWTRVAKRGYNQAQVIAQELAYLSNKPYLAALKRVRHTKLQSHCSAAERAKNVKDAFILTIDSLAVEGKRVLLVDDLMTTGSTIYAAGMELAKTRPQEIYALVACRVL